jgi:GT2 family glycosyltransferase
MRNDWRPTKVLELELSRGLPEALDAAGYGDALVLIRDHGRPAGLVRVACPEGRLTAAGLREALQAAPEVVWRVTAAALERWLLRSQLAAARPPAPSWSVIVCTRDRTEALRRCLRALAAARGTGGEILVVDNDPPTETTRDLVDREFPQVRYLREPRRGLNWARTAGARAATGDILLYTDDDVIVDAGWIAALVAAFESPRTAAATGLTLPYELETEAQAQFEQWGGHGRGFERRVFDDTVIPPAAAGLTGHGANMAFRREVLLREGLFETGMDVGTPTQSGGDAYALYRVLHGGYQIVYTPEAVVWHQHRRDAAGLRRMLYGYSVGVYAFLLRALLRHGDAEALWVGAQWFRKHHLKTLGRLLNRQPGALPASYLWAELRGALASPWAYWQARRLERAHPRQGAAVADVMTHEPA